MGKSILVTGGCGFIGANLVPMLTESNVKIRVIDNLSRGREANLTGVDVEIVKGDIRDPRIIAYAVSGMDWVIHLAASGSVIESVANPTENFDVNVRGTLSVLQACVDAGVGKFLFASTGGALIGNAEPPVSEESLPKPLSPYGASKLCGEAYCHAFAKSYGLHTVALRFANIYGPHSAHKKGAITVISKALIRGEPIVIYGDGNASRDFLYVDDLCQSILLVLDQGIEPGAVFHLASGVETRIGDLARYLMEIADTTDHPIYYESARRGEVIRNFASFEKARTKLGFRPRVPLVEGLRITWNWFRQHTATAV